MKTIDIAKIRQLLTEIKTAAGEGQRNVFFFLKADQALALLPCKTCRGTGKTNKICVDIEGVEFVAEKGIPCPDCQLKPVQEESPPSTMWEHLH